MASAHSVAAIVIHVGLRNATGANTIEIARDMLIVYKPISVLKGGK